MAPKDTMLSRQAKHMTQAAGAFLLAKPEKCADVLI
jgi:hypothetical protein